MTAHEYEMAVNQELEMEFEGGGTITMPPITITVRPFAVLDRFEFDKSAIRPFHVPIIQRIARRILAGRIRDVRLVGHADSRGPASYNLALGTRRAEAVRAALVRELERLRRGSSAGVRFTVQSLGETRPAVSNTTPTGRALNRRVQVFLTGGAPPPGPSTVEDPPCR
jgi:outer membrane protein OmpA-like peptidoglycan-associated protein